MAGEIGALEGERALPLVTNRGCKGRAPRGARRWRHRGSGGDVTRPMFTDAYFAAAPGIRAGLDEIHVLRLEVFLDRAVHLLGW